MPRVDVLRHPATSSWSVLPDLGAALAAIQSGGSDPDGTALVAVVGADDALGDTSARAAIEALGLHADDVLTTFAPSTKAGAQTTIPLMPGAHAVRRVVLVGVDDGSDAAWRSAGAAIGRATRGRSRVVHAVAGAAGSQALAAYVEAVVLASWSSPRWTRKGPTVVTHPASEAVVAGTEDAGTVADAEARARAQLLARGLSMTPSNTKNPAWLARQARAVAKQSHLDVRVWDERQLAREGFGGLIAVGSGSATPPRLVQLDHVPDGATAATPRVVLVGKGITFDTGGLQVKPVDGMVGMKTDMSG
ncbi:MAG TPA: M17 family peptidase N-terminal domain-containing protein, partial [Ornithinibacter sp.]|nr:M17 family peptidase N-terminal domain-containing protein [Ornithinibacter sp.]